MPSPSYLDEFGPLNYDYPDARSPPSKKLRASSPTASNLGIDEEIAVKKRVRAPAVKLDEQRLLSAAGIPRLRSQAHKLKIKGKGYEFSDAARLLSFYQLWLDDLFPKARFLDALAMVEKLGHKKTLVVARNEWINQDIFESSNPVAENNDDLALGPDSFVGHDTTQQPRQHMPNFHGQDAAVEDLAPPPQIQPTADVPDDDDLYEQETSHDALPINILQSEPLNDQDSDNDDLDAMIAEAEKVDGAQTVQADDFADEEEVMRDF
ncbi:hypothetical protein CDD82_810 [Ophiocordyceps australis]|uniref:Chromosome segregation in meiosis protein n=1 Tax=Ophiocordyceps australis TaxID=1399860 RepID=A0A2C5YF49_9HYPO|nr:hypothetical protein CDD82_810 [Ophiocordyceps australis]